jgi:hypothetical protein
VFIGAVAGNDGGGTEEYIGVPPTPPLEKVDAF